MSELLLCYQSAWLRLGLQTVLGLTLAPGARALRGAVAAYLLGCPELEATYRDSKRGLFDENP